MDQDTAMTYEDSSFCTFYEFPSKAFPRLRYIQDNLKSFYPRFQRTVENLPLCLKRKNLMEDLTKKVTPLETSMPQVILFGEKHSMIHKDYIVASINRLDKNEFTISTFLRKDLPPRVSVDTPQVLVYRCSSDQVEQEIIHLEQELPKTGVDNVFLLLDVRGRSENAGRVLEAMISSLTDTHREFWKDKMIVNTPDQDISTRISNHLEMCILKEFKRIDDCIAEFISVQRKVASISSLESDLVSAANKFFQNKIVVQDLMNLAYQGECSDQFLQEQIIWFIQREILEELHAQFKMAAGDIHAMLDEMKFEEKCKTKISPTTWLSIKSELSKVFIKNQMDINYQRGYRRTSGSQQTARMLMWDLQPVRKDVERFLQGVQKGLITLRQLKFELNGILKNTIFSQQNEAEGMRTVATYIRDYWKEKLMQMDEVQGCGDYFGTWTIFISNQNSMAKEQEVRQKIAMCLSRYPYEYDIKISTTPMTFANPKPGGASNQMQQLYFKAGQKLRWQGEKGHLRYGTLGIFVQGKNEPSVYFVTNGHLTIGKGNVYCSVQDECYEELGTESWTYVEGLIDIAAVKVKSGLLTRCIFHYENYYGEQCSYVVMKTSEDTFEQLVGQKVYKRGGETGLRVGIISSKSVDLKKEGTTKAYSMLISPLPGSEPDEAEFATEGDSGSVVSLYTVIENIVMIIAMIIGGFELKLTLDERVPSMSQGNDTSEQNAEKLCLAFSLMDGVDALNKKYDLDLVVKTNVVNKTSSNLPLFDVEEHMT